MEDINQNLNTSYVKVQQISNCTQSCIECNLNTSYVKVQQVF